MPQQVGDKYKAFGTFLLRDDKGHKVRNMRENFRGNPEKIASEILTEWLAGTGAEVSWESLIATLKECELPYTANQIQMALKQSVTQ